MKSAARRYMVLEWVDGRLLRQILNEAKNTFHRNAPPKLPSASAKSPRLHSQPRRLVHRDLKPENIMVDAEDRNKTHRLRPSLPTPGSRRLTFAKLNQAMGDAGLYFSGAGEGGNAATPRSDIYALGIMFLRNAHRQSALHRPPIRSVIMNERLINHPNPGPAK